MSKKRPSFKSLRLGVLLDSMYDEINDSRSKLSMYLDRKGGSHECQNFLYTRQKSWSSRYKRLFFGIILRLSENYHYKNWGNYLEKFSRISVYDHSRYEVDGGLSKAESAEFNLALKQSRKRSLVVNFDLILTGKWKNQMNDFISQWWTRKDSEHQQLVDNLNNKLRGNTSGNNQKLISQIEKLEDLLCRRGGLSRHITHQINITWFRIMVIDKRKGLHGEPRISRIIPGVHGRGNSWTKAGQAIALAILGNEYYLGLNNPTRNNEELANRILVTYPTFESAQGKYFQIYSYFVPKVLEPRSSRNTNICSGCKKKATPDVHNHIRYCNHCGLKMGGTISRDSEDNIPFTEYYYPDRFLPRKKKTRVPYHERVDRWENDLLDGIREISRALGCDYWGIVNQGRYLIEKIRESKRK